MADNFSTRRYVALELLPAQVHAKGEEKDHRPSVNQSNGNMREPMEEPCGQYEKWIVRRLI